MSLQTTEDAEKEIIDETQPVDSADMKQVIEVAAVVSSFRLGVYPFYSLHASVTIIAFLLI